MANPGWRRYVRNLMQNIRAGNWSGEKGLGGLPWEENQGPGNFSIFKIGGLRYVWVCLGSGFEMLKF